MQLSPRHVLLVAALALSATVTLGACSSTDIASTTTSAPTTATPATNPAGAQIAVFDRTVQAALKKVGCYGGKVDGIIGPETDAAVVAFQTAAGLTVDGQLGPATSAALKADAAAGKTVCTGSGSGSGTTTTAKSTGTTTKPVGTTTTTAASGGVAPCTASAISQGLGVATHSVTIESYVCSEGWAAGTQDASPPQFILQSVKGVWVVPGQTPCGTASAGLPPIILETACAAPK